MCEYELEQEGHFIKAPLSGDHEEGGNKITMQDPQNGQSSGKFLTVHFV